MSSVPVASPGFGEILPPQAGPVTIPRRSEAGGALRIATLSWARDAKDLAASQFLTDLAAAAPSIAEGLDLLLCAGWTVDVEPAPRRVLEASCGASVLYEVRANEGTRWTVAYERDGVPESSTIRGAQRVFTSEDDPSGYAALAEALDGGEGYLRVDGVDVPLLLFVCGENNALGYHESSTSAVWFSKRAPRLLDLLSRRWIALNPAHQAYWPHVARSGFAKVGRAGDAGPVLGKLVEWRGRYPDGTRAPVALVHANNWQRDSLVEERATRPFASVVFERDAGRVPITPAATADDPSKRWAVSLVELAT